MNAPPRSLNLRRRCACGLLTLAVLGGCAAPFKTNYLSGSRRLEAGAGGASAAASASDATTAAYDPKAISLRKAMGQEPSTPDEALAGVLDQLREIHAIDPAAEQQLIADLKGAKPEHYALIVEQFQAALAYRQQLAERESQEQMQLASDAATSESRATSTAAHVVSHHGAPHAPAPTASVVADPPVEPQDAVVVSSSQRNDDHQARVESESVPGVADDKLRQASLNAAAGAVPMSGDWRQELDASIADLERTAPAQPATVTDLDGHFRLRVMQLIAGREEDAYRPIPGASPAQQDYWSKQLYAMAAYLKGAGTIDDKQRAAAALVHLDDARAALAQLATLQIHNLAFVKRVDGFGAYETLPDLKFEPGATVTLYAEVENFASTSTAQGFETLLSTSYQVLDASGRRIEGAQFPDVADVCKGRRRDFHLQYGVKLPKRISPGKYQLELMITDQRSGKLGRAALPFEINAER
jgi:hypothetical protein